MNEENINKAKAKLISRTDISPCLVYSNPKLNIFKMMVLMGLFTNTRIAGSRTAPRPTDKTLNRSGLLLFMDTVYYAAINSDLQLQQFHARSFLVCTRSLNELLGLCCSFYNY